MNNIMAEPTLRSKSRREPEEPPNLLFTAMSKLWTVRIFFHVDKLRKCYGKRDWSHMRKQSTFFPPTRPGYEASAALNQGLSSIANRHPLRLAIPIVPSHTLVETLGRLTKVHIIPSHCTMGRNGQTGLVPKCPICYALYIPTVHPIPLHHGRDWTDEGCIKVSYLLDMCGWCVLTLSSSARPNVSTAVRQI